MALHMHDERRGGPVAHGALLLLRVGRHQRLGGSDATKGVTGLFLQCCLDGGQGAGCSPEVEKYAHEFFSFPSLQETSTGFEDSSGLDAFPSASTREERAGDGTSPDRGGVCLAVRVYATQPELTIELSSSMETPYTDLLYTNIVTVRGTAGSSEDGPKPTLKRDVIAPQLNIWTHAAPQPPTLS
ncbi:hypothetical protein C8R44DRAFT_739867 [Mycena epipterygia]|nr:hypothetical protein C8R44DRAFT_739867 [Mycena epipterygia]